MSQHFGQIVGHHVRWSVLVVSEIIAKIIVTKIILSLKTKDTFFILMPTADR
jgi:hypothetical protein